MRRLLFQPPPSRTVAPLYFLVLVLLLPSIRHSQAQGQAPCTENCVDACAQGSFADCQVTCNNTVADAVTTCQAATFDRPRCSALTGPVKTFKFRKAVPSPAPGKVRVCNVQSNQSTIECLSNACDNAQFHASAVFCEPYYACGSAWFFECNCCDGYSSSCGTAPSCQDTKVLL